MAYPQRHLHQQSRISLDLATARCASLSRLTATLVLVASVQLILVGAAEAACTKGVVTCTNLATVRTCTAPLVCNPGANSTTRWDVQVWSSSNVTVCGPSIALPNPTSTVTLSAKATTMAPTTRFCNFRWSAFDSLSVDAGNVFIDQSDGLPVELMDFSLEPDAPPASD